jgi:glutamate-5-semialdehyde dehydrogenase
MERAGEKRGQKFKLHVVESDCEYLPDELFTTQAAILRAEGEVHEPIAEALPVSQLGHEWEWEETPEISLAIVDDLGHAVKLFNEYSPQFVASLIAEDEAAHKSFYQTVNAPFVGNGFTRWVDGQYALNRPELGLSNWQNGRLFARGGILSGDGVFTVRTRVTQINPGVHR